MATLVIVPLAVACLGGCGGGGDDAAAAAVADAGGRAGTAAESATPGAELQTAQGLRRRATVRAPAVVALQPAAPAPDAAVAAAAAPSPSCSVLPALPSVPAGARLVTEFGAVPDDGLPDDAAIAAGLRAVGPGGWLVFPPGRYIQARSILVTQPGATLWGPGATLHATDPTDHTLGLRADRVRVYGFTLTAVTDVRRSTAEQARISVYRDWRVPGLQTGNVVRGVTITHGATPDTPHAAGSVGVLVSAATHFTIADNTVRRTLADGIHVTGGSRNGRIVNNRVRETGDDMIAMVSYLGSGWQARLLADPAYAKSVASGAFQVSDILVQNNDVADSYWGRGISVVGSRNISVRSNQIAGISHGAGVLVAQEGGYFTQGPRNVLVDGNAIARVQNTLPPFLPPGDANAAFRADVLAGKLRTGHGAIEVHAIQNTVADTSTPALSGVLALRDLAIQNNQIRDSATDGVRIGVSTGAGLISRLSVTGNQTAQLAGAAMRNLLNDASALACSGNTLDGAAASIACTLATPPVVTGAALDCAALP